MKKKVVNQSDMKDCACACLSSIISYYGGYVPKHILSDMLLTNTNGTNAYQLIETAKKIGFNAKGVECNFSYLKSAKIKLPVIAHVKLASKAFHYVVLYEINNKEEKIVIMDPLSGMKKISFQDFQKIYNKILILLYPIKKMPIYEKQNLFKLCKKYIIPHQKDIFVILVLSFLFVLGNILTAFYFKYIIDMMTSFSMLQKITTLLVVVLTAILITDYLRNCLFIKINKKLDESLFNDTIHHLFSLPYLYFKNRTTGDIMTRIQDLNMIRNSLSEMLILLFVDTFLAIFSLLFLFQIHVKLTLFVIVIIVCYGVVILLFHKKMKNLIIKNKMLYANVQNTLLEELRSYETLKGLHIEKYMEQKLMKQYKQFLSSYQSLNKFNLTQTTLKNILYYIANFGSLFLGGYYILNGEISSGTLMTFSVILGYFLGPIRNVLDLEFVLKDAYVSLKRLGELFEIKQEEKKNTITFKERRIKVNNLSFSYDNITPILSELNLNIEKGKNYMLIGESGSGKSTFVKILMKYYEIQTGQVMIGNTDINDYSADELRNHIAYVSQTENLFSDTLYENIKLSSNNSKKVDYIARLMYVKEHPLFHKDMLIEEQGYNLSGGERQRIVLARTLMQNKDIVIFDESFHEISTNMERKILKNIFREFKDTTFLIVSHRMDNMDLFDSVLRFKNGSVETLQRNAKKKGENYYENIT